MIRVFAIVLLLTGLSAEAQQPARIRGVVEAFDGKTLVVKDAGSVQVGEKTELVFTQPIRLADIRPGDFLGVTSTKGPGGQLTAYEVRRFPKPLNPGHRPFDGGANQTMTNATVGTVAPVLGRARADPDLRRRLAEDHGAGGRVGFEAGAGQALAARAWRARQPDARRRQGGAAHPGQRAEVVLQSALMCAVRTTLLQRSCSS